MSDEEKKAIEKLSSKQNETTWVDTIRQIKREEINDAVITRQKYITTILNLIEKQQKEIEKLKQEMEERLIGREEITKYEMGYEIENNYISKDKIRDKIKELENKKNCGNSIVFWEISSQIDLLKELLEEE